MPLRARLLVAAQLAHRLRLPDVAERRRLGLHHDERDAVHEQHEVGLHDLLIVLARAGAAALAGAAHAELRRDDVVVETDAGLGVVEVEEADGGRLLPAAALDGERHAVGEVRVDLAVPREARGVDVAQVEDDALRVVLGHPLVEAQQGGSEPPREQHAAFAVALRRQLLARYVRVPEPLEEFASGVLGGVEFVELGRGGHWTRHLSRCATGRRSSSGMDRSSMRL